MLQKLSVPLLAAAILLLSIPGLYGAGTLQIRLMDKVHVKSGKVLLTDIASLQGPDADSVHTFGRLPIVDAPEFGTVKTFSRHQIDEIVRRSLDDATEMRISGAPIVQILLERRQITAEEIVPVLRAFIADSTPWREEEIDIHALENLEKIEVPSEPFDLKVSEKDPVIGRGKILVSFDAVRNGKKLTSFWVVVGARVKARILTAGKSIPYRKVIAPDDVVMAETEIEDLDAAFIRNAGEAIGNVAKRSFSTGDPLTREALMQPFLVKSGETVNLRLERNGLVLEALARAEQDGRLGQIIRVRNLEFSSVLKARVTGRSQVEMP